MLFLSLASHSTDESLKDEMVFLLEVVLLLEFTPWEPEQPLRGTGLQEKKYKKIKA